ncbi:putative membrane protein [Clostridium argentinense CDC 2741]|uniref:Putative membrane protein n=1 Tax=Clostridium argentinense CDC 2741 TaxID=1418104 RepID=A0A0C1R1J3_9CLOT|nr:hypothetical protein [Clostridium argentinense]KIE47272.1 putative membrane protein [Clostridium argentinense CDC 2741]
MKKYKYIARLAGTISMLLMMYLLFSKLENDKDAWIIIGLYIISIAAIEVENYLKNH